jgi:hypothetical protein
MENASRYQGDIYNLGILFRGCDFLTLDIEYIQKNIWRMDISLITGASNYMKEDMMKTYGQFIALLEKINREDQKINPVDMNELRRLYHILTFLEVIEFEDVVARIADGNIQAVITACNGIEKETMNSFGQFIALLEHFETIKIKMHEQDFQKIVDNIVHGKLKHAITKDE